MGICDRNATCHKYAVGRLRVRNGYVSAIGRRPSAPSSLRPPLHLIVGSAGGKTSRGRKHTIGKPEPRGLAMGHRSSENCALCARRKYALNVPCMDMPWVCGGCATGVPPKCKRRPTDALRMCDGCAAEVLRMWWYLRPADARWMPYGCAKYVLLCMRLMCAMGAPWSCQQLMRHGYGVCHG